MMLVHPSVKKTCPTCETPEEAEEEVWTMRLMWLAPLDVNPGKIVWNSTIPLDSEGEAPLKNVPYSP